ncbi:mitogen-activated protein kinase 18 [Artemisia annua]|uniref:Mitogen-activated protein kinase 18 n=1 Tax=Artemisia annua TaxID=35608 RepID=A0A2U1QEJ4_ARTAN|nr:mitogen-activated protein kinase 18 [Artemisia annua]
MLAAVEHNDEKKSMRVFVRCVQGVSSMTTSECRFRAVFGGVASDRIGTDIKMIVNLEFHLWEVGQDSIFSRNSSRVIALMLVLLNNMRSLLQQVRNDNARKYLTDMRRPVTLSEKFSNVDPLALGLLQRLLAFDSKDQPTAEQAEFLPTGSMIEEVSGVDSWNFSFTDDNGSISGNRLLVTTGPVQNSGRKAKIPLHALDTADIITHVPLHAF